MHPETGRRPRSPRVNDLPSPPAAGHLPPPPGLPTVRAFQAAQGTAALDWLRQRIGRE